MSTFVRITTRDTQGGRVGRGTVLRRRTRGVALSLALLLAAGTTVPLPSASAEVAAELGTLVLSTSSVDVDAGDATFEVTLTASHPAGVDHVSVSLASPADDAGGHNSSWGLWLVDGSEEDDTWTGELTIPRYSRPGDWDLSVDLYAGGGSTMLTSEQLSARGLPSTIAVTSTTPDTQAPALTSFTFDPSTVDASSCDAQVHVTVEATDDRSGVDQVYVWFQLDDPEADSSNSLMLTSGTPLSGTWTGLVTLPGGSTGGTWTASLSMDDGTQNSVYLSAAELDTAGHPTSLTVTTDAPDVTPPTLDSLAVDQASVDVGSGDAFITVDIVASDVGCGVGTGEVRLTSPDGATTVVATLYDYSDADTTSWQGELVIPGYSMPGDWELEVDLVDAAGNLTEVGAGELAARGLPSSIEVLNDVGDGPIGYPISGRFLEPYEVGGSALPVPDFWAQLVFFDAEWGSWGTPTMGSESYADVDAADGAFELFLAVDDARPGRTWAIHFVPPTDRMGADAVGGTLGSALIPLTLPSEPTEVVLGDLTVPEPNVVGVLRDREASSEDPIPFSQARLVTNVDGSSYDWTAQYVSTSEDGEFAFHVADADLGRAALRFDEGFGSRRDLVSFTLPLGDLDAAARSALDVRYPEPNVAGRLVRPATADDVADADPGTLEVGDPIGVAYVSIQVQRRIPSSDEDGWEWMDGSGRTDDEGRFWILAEFLPGFVHRLSIDAGPVGEGLLPAFTVLLDTSDPVGLLDLELTYPEPNLAGVLRDGDGTPVEGSWVYLRQVVDDGSSTWTRWLDQSSQTDADGRFAFFLSDELLDRHEAGEVLRLAVSPPWGRRGTLPEFRWDLPVGLTAEQRVGLDITFPEPNISGTILDGSDPVTSAYISVQRRVTDHGQDWWEHLDASAYTDEEGRFVLHVTELEAGDLRLRVDWYQDDGASLRFTVPLVAGAATGLTIEVPSTNVSGTVLADLGSGPVGVPGAFLELRRWVPESGYWDWTDVYTYTRSDGSFDLIVDEGLLAELDRLELRVRPPGSLEGSMPAFGARLDRIAGPSGSLLDLELIAPPPNLSGVLLDPDGNTVARAWFSLEREVTEEWGTYWEWVDAYGSTGPDGRFALDVTDVDARSRYRLRFDPPWNDRARLVGFSFVIPGQGVATDLEVRFPSPNVTGRVVDVDGSTPVRDAWVTVESWNEEHSYWEWGQASSTTIDGAFVLFVDGSGEHRITVQGPWNRGDLVRFSVPLTGDEGSWEDLELRFPTPNLSTVLTDGDGTPVPYGHVWVERRGSSEDGSWLDLWQSADRQGRVALLVPEPGDYRLHVSPPWGSSLPTFDQPFSVEADGTVTGIGAQLAFPEPNLRVEVRRGSGAAITYANVEVRPAAGSDDERWSVAWATTPRSGVAGLLLEPGSYRVFVHPPWHADDLAFTVFDVEIVADADPLVREVVLGPPNVRGTVEVASGSSAAWSWIEVLSADGEADLGIPGTHVRRDGSFSLGLPTGSHLLRVWSSDARASSGPLEAVVTIDADGTLTSWRYALEAVATDNCPDGIQPCTLELSFEDDAVRANLSGSVLEDGAPVVGAFVTARVVEEDGTTSWSRTAVTDEQGGFALLVPEGVTVRLTVFVTDTAVPFVVEVDGEHGAGTTGLTVDVGRVASDAEVGE